MSCAVISNTYISCAQKKKTYVKRVGFDPFLWCRLTRVYPLVSYARQLCANALLALRFSFFLCFILTFSYTNPRSDSWKVNKFELRFTAMSTGPDLSFFRRVLFTNCSRLMSYCETQKKKKTSYPHLIFTRLVSNYCWTYTEQLSTFFIKNIDVMWIF